MSNFNSLKFNRPSLFSPTVIRSVADGGGNISLHNKENFSDSAETSLGNSSSFKYDLNQTGLKSTQQLNINWSSFENHTFFNSARLKTQVAFDKIVNYFPFDGTKEETELFFDGLTGFEKYVYDELPKNKGYLFFSGTNGEASGGTYVSVKDVAGTEFPAVSRLITGEAMLDPGLKSTTIEFQLFLPQQSNPNMTLLQKISGSTAGNEHGFALTIPLTGSSTFCNVSICFVSGTKNLTQQVTVPKGQFNHIAFVWDRTPVVNKIFSYLNQELFASSSTKVEIESINTNSTTLIIGSGSTINTIGFTPTDTLSGALDELRIWHTIRSERERKEFEKKSVYANDNLKLYYKFNEPSGSNSRIVLDHSNNSLHGTLSSAGYTLGVRERATGSLESPMTYEKLANCPILFPDHTLVDTFKTSLLESAEVFDANNPNLIVRLVPKHYLLEGQVFDGLSTEEGSILDQSTSEAEPRTNKLGDTQLLLSMLWTWAKYFDELKLYIQAFGDLHHVDYDTEDTTPDQFLQLLAEKHGFKLPSLFNNASIPQFVNGENLDSEYGVGTYSLKTIQNEIWRRILINLKDITTSKGTIHSIKSFIRSVGIDPDSNFRIREFGGATKRALVASRETRTKISSMANFISGGHVASPFLSGSRTEPGLPLVSSLTVVTAAADGFYTSGSWTYEANLRFVPENSGNHSFFRLMTTGSAGKSMVANLVAVSGSGLQAYFLSNLITTSSYNSMSLDEVDLFDGNVWNVSFGRDRNDFISSSVSSSYFLRCGRVDFEGKITEEYITSSYFDETLGSPTTNVLQVQGSAWNASGSYFAIGSSSLDNTGYLLTNNSNTSIPTNARATDFKGRIGHIRFWSKALTLTEWREHVRNFNSLGVQSPLTNFNFNSSVSGSWERLRLDVTTDQETSSSNSSGIINFVDYSQNMFHLSGTNFPTSSNVTSAQRFYYSHISPKFDEASTVEKVRVRGFLDSESVINNESGVNFGTAPVYEIERSETPIDNPKFAIDFSIIDALNQDIINIFSTFDCLDNIIGDPELMFSMDYPKMEELRNIYFNRLTERINLKGFFEFFRWFDQNMGTFIEQLIPRKTKFLGINFRVESHLLERPKIEYMYGDNYVNESHKSTGKDRLLLQQLVGPVGRY